MNSKRFIKLSLSLTLILLILVASVQIAIDPLFQYHKPWFGLEPVIKSERYQDAGMAKMFDYDNVIMGSSMSQIFRANEYKDLFGGKTIKLTMEGSSIKDWTYLLSLIEKSHDPKSILINLDPYVFEADPDELRHELPDYLYDYDPFNDVNYLFNFDIVNDFTVDSLKKNKQHNVPDMNDAFVWSHNKNFGAEYVLSQHEMFSNSKEDINYCYDDSKAIKNINLLIPFIESMSETQFVFFCSPFSMLYWNDCVKENSIEDHKRDYLLTIGKLIEHDNVKIFLWNDEEMLRIMSDLDNYCDVAHYSERINSLMLYRITRRQGLLTKENYKREIDKLFNYINNYNYDELFIQNHEI